MLKRLLARLRCSVDAGGLCRAQLPTVAVLLVVVGSTVAAQHYPPFNEEDLSAAMSQGGLAFELLDHAVAKDDVVGAKDYLPRLREQLAPTISFWRRLNKGDAVEMLRRALSAMDDLDALLSVETVDSTAINGQVERLEAACEACHVAYREQDPVTKEYRLKAGSTSARHGRYPGVLYGPRVQRVWSVLLSRYDW